VLLAKAFLLPHIMISQNVHSATMLTSHIFLRTGVDYNWLQFDFEANTAFEGMLMFVFPVAFVMAF
jgi:hypothetical protein